MALYRSQMLDYAAARLKEAARVLATHTGDGTGCCAVCGRPAMCPPALAAVELHEQYRPWLATPGPAPAGVDHFDTGAEVVRPYTGNVGPAW